MSTESGDPAPEHPRQSTQVVSSRLGDAGVLVNLRTNRIFELNATGFRIWELIGDGLDLAEIERTLSHEFSVEPERMRAELHDLVVALAREGLLDVGGRD
jgi:hypothetical protein